MADDHSSRTHPGLDKKPGESNWVDKAGGLPSYIDRIARHLHSDEGMSISHAIAAAVNTVKRWAKGGGGVSASTQAKAAKAVAQWERKKNMSAHRGAVELAYADHQPPYDWRHGWIPLTPRAAAHLPSSDPRRAFFPGPFVGDRMEGFDEAGEFASGKIADVFEHKGSTYATVGDVDVPVTSLTPAKGKPKDPLAGLSGKRLERLEQVESKRLMKMLGQGHEPGSPELEAKAAELKKISAAKAAFYDPPELTGDTARDLTKIIEYRARLHADQSDQPFAPESASHMLYFIRHWVDKAGLKHDPQVGSVLAMAAASVKNASKSPDYQKLAKHARENLSAADRKKFAAALMAVADAFAQHGVGGEAGRFYVHKTESKSKAGVPVNTYLYDLAAAVTA